MNRIHWCFLILFVLSAAVSQRVARYYDDEVERGDAFIDKLLREMMHDHGHEYDPYKLEDGSIGFAKKIFFVNVTGEAKLHNGYIIGLSTLHRPDHCVVREEGDRLHVKADLGAGVIKCHYDGTVKFMNFGPTIKINAEVKYIEAHMEFSVDSNTGNNGVLHEYYIDDMKGMTVEITGLGPLNWATNYIISGVTLSFKGFIKKMLENKVRSHVSERLPKYQFPVDGTNTDAPETEDPKEPETEFPEEQEMETPQEPQNEDSGEAQENVPGKPKVEFLEKIHE